MIVGDTTIIRKLKGDEIMPLIAGFYVLVGSTSVYAGILTLASLFN